jgi:uncharacterized protein involved in tellurium resistance
MLELRDSLQAMAGAVNLRADHGGVDETLRRALHELCSGLALELGLDLVELDDRSRAILAALGESHGHTDVASVLAYLAASMADGVRRPGAWERDCVAQLFGPAAIELAEEEIEESYQGLPYRET